MNKGLCFLRLKKTTFYCFSFERSFSSMFFSHTRKERETQPAEHVSRRRPLHPFHRVLARHKCFSSNMRKDRETQLPKQVSCRRPLRLLYRVSACLSLFPKNNNRGFSFHLCGELFLLYVTPQTTKSQMVPYHSLYPLAFRPFPHLRKKRVGGRERTQLVGLLG